MSSSADFISRFRSDPAFRQHAERDPLAALRSMGIAVPAGVSIDFLDNAFHAVERVFDRQPMGAADVIDDALLEGVAGGVLADPPASPDAWDRFAASLIAAVNAPRPR